MTARTGEVAPSGADDGRTSPLSSSQARLWFLDRVTPQQSLYNIHLRYIVRGELRVDLVERALSLVVERHTVLRSTYHEQDGEPVQVTQPAAPIAVAVRPAERTDDDSAFDDWLRAQAGKPFDLTTAPLLRAAVATDPRGDHHLVVTVHHIAADGWSLDVLGDELWTAYDALADGRPPPLPDLPAQYHDHATEQQRQLRDGTLDGDRAYWREQLAGASYTELPPDVDAPSVSGSPGDDVEHMLPLPLVRELEALARRHRCSLFIVLQAALDVLLHRVTATTDVVTGTATAARVKASLAPLIGFFTNMLVFRVPVTGEMTFADVVGHARRTVFDALDHQSVPFDTVVSDLRPARVLGQNPLFQVAFQLLYVEDGARRIGSTDVRRSDPMGSGSTWFDVVFAADRGPGGCLVNVSFDRTRFRRGRMQRLLDAYVAVLEQVVEDPAIRVRAIDLGTEADRPRAPISVGAGDATDVVTLVRRQAERTPDAVAVSCRGRRIGYAELVQWAEAVAGTLADRSIGPGDRVGLMVEPTERLVVAMLGVLMSGAAYVPLPPHYPDAWLARTIGSADIGVVVVTTPDAGTRVDADVVVVPAGPPPPGAERAPVPGPRPADMAYVLFTSGSTGAPKGVCVTHANVAAFAMASAGAFGIGEGTHVLQLASVAFDASVLEILTTLAVGGRVCVSTTDMRHSPELLVRMCREEAVTVALIPPALLTLIDPADLPGLEVLLVGGEAFGPELVNAWRRPGLRFFNAYGPTETTVASLAYECADPSPYTAAPPIGTALAGDYAVVLDAYGKPAPVGVHGELVIGGAGVALGYLHDPALTAERFVASPFGPAGGRMYRTGDVCVRLEDGNIRFVGRVDDQVKVRGHRISLLEVERALARLDGVEQAAVLLAHGDSATDKRLVAYVRTRDGATDHVALRRALSRALPSYMLPAAFVDVPEFPRTTGGKVDRRALAALPAGPARGGPRAASSPEPATVASPAGRVAELFARRLRLASAPEDVSFFDLGGNSLQLTSLCAEIASTFGVTVTTQDLLTHQSPAQVARLVATRSAGAAAGDGPAVGRDQWRVLRDGADGVPVVVVHDGSGSLFSYADLQRALGAAHPVFGLDAPALETEEPTVDDLAAEHMSAVRRHLGDRSLILLGWSFGGLVAHAMYRRSLADGRGCARLVMVDTLHPADRRVDARVEEVFFEHLRGDGLVPPDAVWVDTDGSPAQRLLAAVERSGADLADWGPGALEQRFARFAAYFAAAGAYDPGRLRGAVALVTATPGTGTERSWLPTLSGDVTHLRLPGDHFSVVRGEGAARIAALVEEQAATS